MVNPSLKKALVLCFAIVALITFSHIFRLTFPNLHIKISLDDQPTSVSSFRYETHPNSSTNSVQSDDHSDSGLVVENSEKTIDDGSDKKIAIGMGITSKKLPIHDVEATLRRIPLFRHFLPSFCDTITIGWKYNFYFGFDKNDGFFINQANRDSFIKRFESIVQDKCPPDVVTFVHFVHCDHNGFPTWAQNDAMLEAYIDGSSYFYRVNDDSVLKSPGWVEAFTDVLKQYDPQYVGVVGPHHKGGNEAILTYDFVHKTHIDVFGFYYPRVFTDWWGDDWITKVYRPGRSTKVKSIKLVHTLASGTRYKVHTEVEKKLPDQVQRDKVTLYRYIHAITNNKNLPPADGSKIIAMSLPAHSKIHLYGVLRNIQLVRVLMPQWILRVYVADGISERWLKKFKILNAQIVRSSGSNIPIELMPFKVMNDEKVDVFVIRNATSRLSERDVSVINRWIESNAGFHCIRDHPRHENFKIAGIGTIGGKRKILQQLPAHPWNKIASLSISPWTWLQENLYEAVKDTILCHDSVSCTNWPNSKPFTVKRFKHDYVGRIFNERMDPADKTADSEIRSHSDPSDCTKLD